MPWPWTKDTQKKTKDTPNRYEDITAFWDQVNADAKKKPHIERPAADRSKGQVTLSNRREISPKGLETPGAFGQYEFDFFSGGQCQIYFGDVLVDDINRIEINVEHPRIPIYGYSSVYYNTTTRGRIIVTGAFSINFKEAGYLPIILNRYAAHKGKPFNQELAKRQQSLMKEAVGVISADETGPSQLQQAIGFEDTHPYEEGQTAVGIRDDFNQAMLANSRDAFVNKWIARQTIEDIMSNADQSLNNPNINAETGMIDSLRVMDPAQFDDYNHMFDSRAESYEDAIWGVQSGSQGGIPRADEITDFDIYMTFGDIDNQLANHTIRRVFNVELVGTAVTVEISGFPTQEVYTFIARDFR